MTVQSKSQVKVLKILTSISAFELQTQTDEKKRFFIQKYEKKFLKILTKMLKNIQLQVNCETSQLDNFVSRRVRCYQSFSFLRFGDADARLYLKKWSQESRAADTAASVLTANISVNMRTISSQSVTSAESGWCVSC